MKKIDITGVFDGKYDDALENGVRIIDRPDVIDIRQQPIEMMLVVKGSATIIHVCEESKQMTTVSKGEICFFGDSDEYIMPQEGSVILLVDQCVQKPDSSTKVRFGFFNRKSKTETVAKKDSNEVQEKNLLRDMMPKIRQVWYQAAGPLSESIVNDKEKFRRVAETVYVFLPKPIQFVVTPEFFVNWCYEKRHIFLIEPPNLSENGDSKILPTSPDPSMPDNQG